MWSRNALDFFLLITGSNPFLILESMRARWSQTRMAFRREIRLIAAATEFPQFPNQHVTLGFSNVWWCVDRYCSFKSDLGECFSPQGTRFSEQKVLLLKTAFMGWLVFVSALLCCKALSPWLPVRAHSGRVDTEDIAWKRRLRLV